MELRHPTQTSLVFQFSVSIAPFTILFRFVN